MTDCKLAPHLQRILNHISVTGVVQGVGFRPFVYNLADQFGLSGWVLNHSAGVDIEAEGPAEQIEAFVVALAERAPPLAHIESLQVRAGPLRHYDRFEIRHSEHKEGRYQLISPDIATCPDCLRELLDPGDRRYRYPFTNCTNCGPRFTIIDDIPYDRPNTTMRAFDMCPHCQREYDDPRNRRFHAQPNACPVCGPQLELVDGQGHTIPAETDVVAKAGELLLGGAVLAIKGLGGFHLACDATNADAVNLLRERKHRPDKPFAVMMATLGQIREHCIVSVEEKALLTAPQCPIVLLLWRPSSTVVAEVAPRYGHLGVMLPYTPLHHILLRQVNRPLVMTSGNLTEEPIAAENSEALRRLGPLADAIVLHDRDIYARYDDSVWFVPQAGEAEDKRPLAQPIRRARGYAPFPIKLPFQAQQILACGAEIKNTFCVTRDQYAFVSQHIGDMENLPTLEHYERTVDLYQRLFRIQPTLIAHDMHPDYMTTRYARERRAATGVRGIAVQHHHAHLAACLADNGWRETDGEVIGVTLDGTGYGPDGAIWGGEWLVGSYGGYRRAGQLEYLPLPGGDASTRSPWRIAFSYLTALLGQVPRQVVPERVPASEQSLLRQQIDRRVNCPLTSSMGRLFDAVSALLGLCLMATYEAQAAIEMEALAAGPHALGSERVSTGGQGYPFDVDFSGGSRVIRLGSLFSTLLSELEARTPAERIALEFHRTVAHITVRLCQSIADETGLQTVALSGGCYQNRLLLALTLPALRRAGLNVLVHRQVPCNDGGLSLGQAAIAHAASLHRQN